MIGYQFLLIEVHLVLFMFVYFNRYVCSINCNHNFGCDTDYSCNVYQASRRYRRVYFLTGPSTTSGDRYFLRTFGGWSISNSSVASFPAKSMIAFLPPG